jgi:hypothetical protein
MKVYTIRANEKFSKYVSLPTGRHEVTIEQWAKAYEYIELAEKANNLLNEGKFEESQKLAVESMCGTMSALSEGLEMDDLLRMDVDKANNLFLTQFDWLQNEKPKQKFKINGKNFEMPNFGERTCGDFVDTMSLLSVYEQYKDADKGIVVAAIYMREGEYYQDLQEIEERIEFLKKYGRMDLFYSCSFFLLSSMMNHKINTERHSILKAELEKLMSTLSAWVSTLYLQTLQNQTYFRIP